MNPYGMELYAETRLEQAREDAAIRRLLKATRRDSEEPSRLRRWLRLDHRNAAARNARPLASASAK